MPDSRDTKIIEILPPNYASPAFKILSDSFGYDYCPLKVSPQGLIDNGRIPHYFSHPKVNRESFRLSANSLDKRLQDINLKKSIRAL